MASKISLSKDLIDVKARNNHRVSVLKPYLFARPCLLIELHHKLKVCLHLFYFIFSKLCLRNWEWGLSTGAAYLWTFTVE